MLFYMSILVRFYFFKLYKKFIFFTFLSFFTVNYSSADAVERLINKEVITEEESYNIDSACKKSDFVKWSLKNVGENKKTSLLKEPFADVKKNTKDRYFIAKAWELGVLDDNVLFYPESSIKKIDALKIILQLEGIAIPRAGFNINFVDNPKNIFERGVISKALQQGIIVAEKDDFFGAESKMSNLECIKLIDAVSLNRKAEQLIFQIETDFYTVKPKQDIFDQVWNTIKEEYAFEDKIDENKMMESAISGLVQSLNDDYTNYFTEEETRDFLFEVGLEKQYGIGAHVGLNKDGKFIIIKPLKDSPAEKSGLISDDIVLEIDDLEIEDKSFEEIVNLIKGEEGTTVKLKIKREGKELIKKIIRNEIKISSVETSKLGDYLLLKVNVFSNTVDQKIYEALKENYSLAKKGVVIDLRSNPGGFMYNAIDLASYFVEDGTPIVNMQTRNQNYKEVTEKNKINLIGVPLIVLVDEYSASASEIFAGAVQDLKIGKVIGNTTFGKGTAQDLLQFYDGSSLKITFSEWRTPNGKVVNGKGIEPDILFENIDNDKEVFEFARKTIVRGQWR